MLARRRHRRLRRDQDFVDDFGSLTDRNANGLADPEDLILDPASVLTVDDDRNGWVDDISGWDFLYGDNNPLDTVEYGHGTGEAKDSAPPRTAPATWGDAPAAASSPSGSATRSSPTASRFAAGADARWTRAPTWSRRRSA